MARGIVTLTGLDEILSDLDNIPKDMEAITAKSLDNSLKDIEVQMKANYDTMLNKRTGVLYNSIGHHVGETYKGVITGSVGVYDYNKFQYPKFASGRTYTAPMVAFFLESGVDPHDLSLSARLGGKGRKEKSVEGGTGGQHGGFAPKPFMSSAFYALSDNIFENWSSDLDKGIE